MFDVLAYVIGFLIMVLLALGSILLFLMILDYYYELFKKKRNEQ